jgi:outer membrane protein, heavy metal efflux system
MHILLLRAATLVAASLPFLAAAAPLSFEAALDLAVQRSEAARSARAGVAGAREMSRSAGQLPDPTLRVGIDNLPVTGSDAFRTARESMTMKRVGLSQEWLSRDKRATREAAADALVSRESVQALASVAETRLQTALAYLDAFYAGEALKLAAATLHHAGEEQQAARSRLAAASGNSAELLSLTGARGIAEDESADSMQQAVASKTVLQRWVGIDADALDAPAAMPVPSEAVYVANHPGVARLRGDIEVARQAAAVASSERQANWTWEIAYGQRTGYSDMLSIGVSIPLQVAPADRQDRETAAKLALVNKAESEWTEASRAATAEYRALVGDAERLQERIDRYRAGVIAPAGQRSAAALAAYRSNQLTLTSLFEARHAEVEAQRKLLTLQRQHALTHAQLAFRPLADGGGR